MMLMARSPCSTIFPMSHVLLQVGNDIFHFLTIVVREFIFIVFHDVVQVAKQLGRHLAEVNDKVQRVLYLMGNTCTQHAERSQFLLLFQPLP